MEMDLDLFVSETLLSIINGVSRAQANAPSGTEINPAVLSFNSQNSEKFLQSHNKTIIQNVDFDISISVTSGSEANGKIKVLSGIFNLDGGGKKKNEDVSINKIKFSVPVSFPTSK